jgi:hypothetical protein
LAGGTAVAIHVDHRGSVDLDLFSRTATLDLDVILARLPETAAVVARSDVQLRLHVDGVPVDIVRYPYPPIEGPQPVGLEVEVAGLRDLAAMKLLAISRRGLRRDFWDLAQILDTGMSLDDALLAYRLRFGRGAGDLYPVLRALTWFEDAERDPILPAGLTPAGWAEIRASFERRVPPAV